MRLVRWACGWASVVSQNFAALALVERRFAPVRDRKMMQVLHSTFGYVQDDELCKELTTHHTEAEF
jgi:hypothetical protein